MASRRTLVIVIVLVVAALAAGIYYVARTRPNIRPSDVATESTAPVSERARGDLSGAPESATAVAAKPTSAPVAAAAPRDNPVRRSLQQKLGRPPGNSGSGPAPRDNDRAARGRDPTATAEPPSSWDSLPEAYVGKVIREQLLPVAQACYDDLAEKGTEGALTLSVAVLGDDDIGGAIDRVDIAKDGTTLEGELTECVRQAAYDMQFDPPPMGEGGGKEFDLTIDFSQDVPKGG